MNGENPTSPAPPKPVARPGLRRYGLLLLSTMLSVGVQGVAHTSDVSHILIAALSGATFLLALRAAELSTRVLNVATAVVVVVVGFTVVRVTTGAVGEGATLLMNAAVVGLAPPAITMGIVHDLRTSRKVRLEAVMGALSLYMLLGMALAFIYGAVDSLGGAPFFAGGQPANVSNCLYFSFATLATVGYGDFVARTELGHTLAVFEMMAGQIYLVTVVGLIVGNLGRAAPQRTQLRD